jgi:Holliday junction DNA helicase RuvA
MPIARIRGVVDERGDDWVIISVVGVGMLASVPSSTAASMVLGQPGALFTHLHVREDALTLFGFSSREELVLFEQLISVSGVGPRVALGLLSALDHGQLAGAIASGRADVLRKVPGVGQKTAERIVLDLRDKVLPPAAGVDVASQTQFTGTQADAEVVSALMGLGYTQQEAVAAAERLPETESGAPLEDRVRTALGFFARA